MLCTEKGFFMKFIFPKNYDFSNKLFGFIDYSTIFINFIWDLFIFCLLNLIFPYFKIKLFLFIIFSFPLLVFSLIGFNHENIMYVLIYLFKYLKSVKYYLYK